ncbi:hypothetical protein Q8G35_04910 [Peribacillus simplex]|uniref:Uncharacterized protein n=2 Tax=Peribacillus TaxID=2675229 RepID=A0AA90NZ58_9BACI|nr:MULTISPECIES: hypothetical protein [Peribacillus]MDP1417744.1 hypothetical protein [Peribacillus simplex]MDP1450399.1 hypothetical protein [Peribacillus frigoritolerans]
MEPLLKVENIKKTYGKSSAAYTALENISFDIHEGEFVGHASAAPLPDMRLLLD